MAKAFVRIHSNMNITVTMGLQAMDATNPDAHVPDRLAIKPYWPKTTVDIHAGSHWYPSEIAEWNTVKALAAKKVLTIGEFSDTTDDEKEQTEVETKTKNLRKRVKETQKALGLEDAVKE